VIKVAVLGAAGRMGATVCEAVAAEPDLELVAAVDPGAVGRPLGELSTGARRDAVVVASLAEIAPAEPEVVVDFTRADVAAHALRWCAEHGVHAVSGTTGLDSAAVERLRVLFDRPDGPNCILAANFAISAVLLMRLAEIAAVHLESVEIVELHHDAKRDAPSGTALETARRIAAAREKAGLGPPVDPTTDEVLPGARGGVAAGGIHVHSVRLRGLVAHEEVVLGGPGQSLTIRQDSYDRTSFMPGVLVALRRVAELPGLTLGLDAVLGL
jgi:4-hydroxy-tetrahydrodipicolinate reductase